MHLNLKNAISPKNIPVEAVNVINLFLNVINLIKAQSLSHIFIICYVMNSDTEVWRLQKHFSFEGRAEMLPVFMENHFYLQELRTDRLWLFRLGLFDKHFKDEPVFLRETTKSIYFRWINLSFEQKGKFWKTCICYCDLTSFQIFEEFADEASNETNQYDALISIWWNVSRFGRST